MNDRFRNLNDAVIQEEPFHGKALRSHLKLSYRRCTSAAAA